MGIILFVRDTWVFIRAALGTIRLFSPYLIGSGSVQVPVAVICFQECQPLGRCLAYRRLIGDYRFLARLDADPCSIRPDTHACAFTGKILPFNPYDLKVFKVGADLISKFIRHVHL